MCLDFAASFGLLTYIFHFRFNNECIAVETCWELIKVFSWVGLLCFISEPRDPVNIFVSCCFIPVALHLTLFY